MADIHHHHDSAVVADRDDGPSAVLIAVIVLMLVGFLIWLFAFSGIVFDNDTDRGPTFTENEGDTNVNVPGGDTTTGDDGTTTDTGPSP